MRHSQPPIKYSTHLSFSCTFCGRSFARSDVLTRHLTLHTRPSNPITKDRRHRILRACSSCKSSKLKCDGLKPTCSKCHAAPLGTNTDTPLQPVAAKETRSAPSRQRCPSLNPSLHPPRPPLRNSDYHRSAPGHLISFERITHVST